MDNPIFIFAGGGTGGHLLPGLSVARELTDLVPGARIVFACSDRTIDRAILDPLPYAIVPQPIKPFPRNVRGWWGFARAYFATARQSAAMIADLKPAAVLGLGGFAAGPLVRRASLRGVPSAMLNPDEIPGKANRLLAPHADAIFTQFASTAGYFAPGLREKVRAVGCPVRRELIGVDRAGALAKLGLRADRKTLLVFGASLGAASINDAMALLAPRMDGLAAQWQLLHLTGAGKGESLRGVYEKCALPVRAMEYLPQMELAYAAADLVVCRGGASTVAELAATGTPSVILPYPYHKDQQQKLNALELERAGGAVVVKDLIEPAANDESLAKLLLPLLGDSARLAKMRDAAKSVGKPNAAREVAQWLHQKVYWVGVR